MATKSRAITLWDGPYDGGEVPETEAEACGKFVYRSGHRMLNSDGIICTLPCYAVYGRVTHFKYIFVGYDFEEKVKEMLDE